MNDPRLVVTVTAGVTALAAAAAGVWVNSPEFGVIAGAAGLIAAIAGVGLGARARQSQDRLEQAEEEIRAVRRELSSINAVLQEEANRRAAEEELGPTPDDIARERGAAAFDAATGLYDEKYFAVLVQQQVAAARRSLRPISVIIFEIDAMGESDSATRLQALGVVGDVVRRTLRESDAACRLGEVMVGAILEDTPEAGAVWAAERVRGTLLSSPVGDALTLSAGVACYPTHALGAAELVHQASRALDEARSRGRDRVELAPDAT
ncbi:MAG TPA: GGDEF domain-containing protein [Acidimicrobiia bacterium]|nr:GGDEF domain-containing protein [Acidimicrobiia bacterium]